MRAVWCDTSIVQKEVADFGNTEILPQFFFKIRHTFEIFLLALSNLNYHLNFVWQWQRLFHCELFWSCYWEHKMKNKTNVEVEEKNCKKQKMKIDERTTKIERKLRVIFNVGSIIMLLAVLTVEALAKMGIYLVKTLLILLVVVMMMLCWAVWAYCNSQVESIHIELNEWKLNVRINGCFGLPCILAVSYHDTLSLY